MAATITQTGPHRWVEIANYIRINLSSEVLILVDDKENSIPLAKPRTLASSDRSKEKTKKKR